MIGVGFAIGIAVGRPADSHARISEAPLSLATTEESSTPITGGRA
jgi:hypothetical protein